MRLFGFEISRTKAAPPTNLQSPSNSSAWWPIVREPFTGAWQRGKEQRKETILSFHAVYSCVTLIASDVSKCRIRLVERDGNGIWNEIDSPSFSPVLRKPNRYQNRIKFFEQWIVSKLLHGNTYVLKERDSRGVVVALYILEPTRTWPLVASDGSIWYQINKDNLAGIDEATYIPASEIIHDVMIPLFHPLCGVSPLTACGIAAAGGLSIQQHSSSFFSNGARPGGILTAPNTISDITADRLKKNFEENFTGSNAGRIAVLGDGLEYKSMAMNAVDAQLIEQLKWSAETVCSCFHVPAYKIGVGAPPTNTNIEALDQQYYSQCLQRLFECAELCLDEGLGLEKNRGTEFDLDDLLRMDTATLIKAESEAVRGGFRKPNEARRRLNSPPVEGGDDCYLQQQNYSLSALAKRDAKDDPFASGKQPTPAPDPQQPPQPQDQQDENQDLELALMLRKGFRDAA